MTDRDACQTHKQRALKRRRAAELLGELEPSRSRDDADAGWNDPDEQQQQQARDAYLRGEVPPHHR